MYSLNRFIAERRADHIVRSLNKYATDMDAVKGLSFCVSIEHAKFMAEYFNAAGIPDICLVGDSSDENRRAAGLPVEKRNSIFAKGSYTDADAKRNILANPFKRFEDMQMLRHTKTLGIIQVEETVWRHLSAEEKLAAYYGRLK